jgi:truncated hemoglobin YjbI
MVEPLAAFLAKLPENLTATEATVIETHVRNLLTLLHADATLTTQCMNCLRSHFGEPEPALEARGRWARIGREEGVAKIVGTWFERVSSHDQLRHVYMKAWRRRAIFTRGWNLRKLKDQYTIVLCALLRDGSIDDSSTSAKELEQITVVPLSNQEFDHSLACLRSTCEETFSLGEHEVWYVCHAFERLRARLVGPTADGSAAPLPPKPDSPEDSLLTRVGGNETLRSIVVELEAAGYVAPPDIVPWLIAFFDGEYSKPSDNVSEFLVSVPQALMMSIMSKTLSDKVINAALTLFGEVWPHFAPPTPAQEQPAAEEPPLTPLRKTPAGTSSTLAGTGGTLANTGRTEDLASGSEGDLLSFKAHRYGDPDPPEFEVAIKEDDAGRPTGSKDANVDSGVVPIDPTIFGDEESNSAVPLATHEVEAADSEVAKILQKDMRKYDSFDEGNIMEDRATPSIVVDNSIQLDEDTVWMFQSESEQGADIVKQIMEDARGMTPVLSDNASSVVDQSQDSLLDVDAVTGSLFFSIFGDVAKPMSEVVPEDTKQAVKPSEVVPEEYKAALSADPPPKKASVKPEWREVPLAAPSKGPNGESSYWWNTGSEKTQWNKPEDDDLPVPAAEKAEAEKAAAEQAAAEQAAAEKAAAEKAAAENAAAEKASAEKAAAEKAAAEKAAAEAAAAEKAAAEKAAAEKAAAEKAAVEKAAAEKAASEKAAASVKPEWREVPLVAPSKGPNGESSYWWNTGSGKTQWKKPEDDDLPVPTKPALKPMSEDTLNEYCSYLVRRAFLNDEEKSNEDGRAAHKNLVEEASAQHELMLETSGTRTNFIQSPSGSKEGIEDEVAAREELSVSKCVAAYCPILLRSSLQKPVEKAAAPHEHEVDAQSAATYTDALIEHKSQRALAGWEETAERDAGTYVSELLDTDSAVWNADVRGRGPTAEPAEATGEALISEVLSADAQASADKLSRDPRLLANLLVVQSLGNAAAEDARASA